MVVLPVHCPRFLGVPAFARVFFHLRRFVLYSSTNSLTGLCARPKQGACMIRLTYSIALLACVSLLAAGCATDPYTGERKASKTAIGAGVGAAAGAAIGAVTGGKHGKRALYGAAAGTLAGAGVGIYMDRQEAKLRERLRNTGVSVTRTGDQIILNMPGNVTFDVDSAQVKPQFHEVLNSVALVLNEFDKTYVDVSGHTDSTGSEEYNQKLSLQRAQSVAAYLIAQRVDERRFVVHGLGESSPVADNATATGRQLNRRVEIHLTPIT